ncbi:6-phosphofructokinase 1, partial [Pancytospora epiphaga]
MLERGELKEGQRDLHALSIVGIPGTIDSDIYGTDVTLGADTALHRIVEVASRLNSTMRSHRRIYILETMGNKCGWLGLMAGVALDADYIFIPEVRKEWREELMRSVSIAVKHHKADILVVVSEGAVEIDGKPITMVEVAKELAEFEPRTLCIGHIQRGGCPSARDAMLGTLSGITATRHLIDSRYDTFSEVTNNRDKMVALCNGKIALIDLKRVVSENKWTESIIKKGESAFTRRTEMFKKVFERYEWHRKSKLSIFGYMDLEKNSEDSGIRPEIEKTSSSVDRDKKENCSFIESHRSISTIPLIRQIGDLENMTLDDSETRKIKSSNSTKVASEASSASKILRICVLNNGEITAGMNGCLNMLVQIGLSIGHKMFYFLNGDRNMQVLKEASLFQFRKDSCASGSVIGASNSTLSTSRIKEQIRAHSLDWLIVVGEMKNINI